MVNERIIERLKKKAKQSFCRYLISAIGFNKRGEIIGITNNKPRFRRFHGGIHAEMALMQSIGKGLKSIIICRVNRTGNLLNIHPCPICQKQADRLGIKIYTIKDLIKS